MNTLKRMIGIAFVVQWGASASALAAQDRECDESVSMAALLAYPDAYHGRALWVMANITIDFENMTACPFGNEADTKNCLWVNIDDGPYKNDQDYARYQSKLRTWEQFNLQTVALHATFDKNMKGHFSMWPAGLRNITEVSGYQGGWSFTSNALTPRTKCAGEMPATVESSERWVATGNLKLRNDNYDGAIADFTRALELDPGTSVLYLLRGNAKKRKRDYAGAIADYTRAIEFDPEYKDVMFAARAGARELTGDLDGAIADYTRAIEIDPKFGGTYNLRGFARQKRGDVEGAAADFAQAERLAPVQ